MPSSSETMTNTHKDNEEQNETNDDPFTTTPTMTRSMFFYWILPLVFFTVATRWGIVAPQERVLGKGGGIKKSRQKPNSVPLDFSKQPQQNSKARRSPTNSEEMKKYSAGYQEVWNIVNQRRQKYNVPQIKSSKKSKSEKLKKASSTGAATTTSGSAGKQHQHPPERTPPPRGSRSDPARAATMELIENRRLVMQQDPSNLYNIVALADAMRQADLTYHDGGSLQMEALELYQTAIDLILKQRQEAINKKEKTSSESTKDELFLPMEQKSIDGKLCALYTSLGKQYFMANMFERAVESYQRALELEPVYLDALGAMGTSLLILGQYQEAGQAFYKVLHHDRERIFMDVFTGLAKVLNVDESAVPGGWDTMVQTIQGLIPELQQDFDKAQKPQQKAVLADSLNRLHHSMFIYHDVKTKNAKEAWEHLSTGYRYKMSVLPDWNSSFESQKISQTKQIFRTGFWPPNVGSDSKTPIFIIGFVRSGSTLLERVLDAHSLIVGTGEDSVFNGRLEEIRNDIVQASMTGDSNAIVTVVQDHADSVVRDMVQRWQTLESQVQRESSDQTSKEEKPTPLRFSDKMLTNFMNVGFLHMLFPKALILHVAREPMDTVFSAYKHEFPTGTLDYTSEFASLAQLYESYRTIMNHWDEVLPGRVTHVRYEDMVHDMPGMARAIINSTGLEWDDDVLDFYKKRHAVNTLSTTQVRKQVYTDSLSAWKRYQEPLQPLVSMLGKYATWDLKTTLPSYTPREEESS